MLLLLGSSIILTYVACPLPPHTDARAFACYKPHHGGQCPRNDAASRQTEAEKSRCLSRSPEEQQGEGADSGAHATKSSQNCSPSSISKPPPVPPPPRAPSFLTIHDASPSSSKSPGRHAPTSSTGEEKNRRCLLSLVNAPPSTTTSTFTCSSACGCCSSACSCCSGCPWCSSHSSSFGRSKIDWYAPRF